MAPDASSPAVIIRRLRKSYHTHPSWRDLARLRFSGARLDVLRDVSLELQPGELFGLLGPNGAGKTTLLKILATLVTPDGGTVSVCGADVGSEPARVRRALGSAPPEERSLSWRLTGRENLELFGALHGLAAEEAARRAIELLALVGLDPAAADRMVGTFSSGMRQRLLIARSLVAGPRVLLLDEPTRSLDPMAARDLRRFIRETLCRERGLTVLLATHDPEEALRVCDRVGILHEGRLLAVGTAEALARAHGEDRWSLVARGLEPRTLRGLVAAGRISRFEQAGTSADGWVEWWLAGLEGEEAAATILEEIVSCGARVSRFQRRSPSLASLIERVVADAAGAPPEVVPLRSAGRTGVAVRRAAGER